MGKGSTQGRYQTAKKPGTPVDGGFRRGGAGQSGGGNPLLTDSSGGAPTKRYPYQSGGVAQPGGSGGPLTEALSGGSPGQLERSTPAAGVYQSKATANRGGVTRSYDSKEPQRETTWDGLEDLRKHQDGVKGKNNG